MIFVVKLSVGIVATSLVIPMVAEWYGLIAGTVNTLASMGL